ncbi:MAG: hypothetical protein OJF59_000684 [Cytophagales bacterium]|nr:MAG: hypothetical protein OJF59_000684 [Cytophagales bacterium]
MKLVPTFRCLNFQESLDFYTKILEFNIDFIHETPTPDRIVHFAGLDKNGCELHLSEHRGDGVFGSVAYVRVDEVDELFKRFVRNGLPKSHKKDSPVHHEPTDQTWGMREFYVDDPSGNTLRFGCAIRG